MTWLKGPGWPDMRGWVALLTFALAFALLGMIRENPALLANASFMQLAGGFVALSGVVVQYLFGSSKSSADARDLTSKALDKVSAGTGAGAGAQPVEQMNVEAENVTVEAPPTEPKP